MKTGIAGGAFMTPQTALPRQTVITMRTETTGDFNTLSLADDDKGLMLQIIVTPEIKKMLRAISR